MARASKSEPKHSETAGDGSVQRPPLSGRELSREEVQGADSNQGKRSKGPLQNLKGRGPRGRFKLKGRGPKGRFKLSREEVQGTDSNSQGKRFKGPLQILKGKRSKGPLQTLKGKWSKGPLQTLQGRGPRDRFKLDFNLLK